jgi:hypothetical protein
MRGNALSILDDTLKGMAGRGAMRFRMAGCAPHVA